LEVNLLQAEDCLVAERKLLQLDNQLEVVGCWEGKHLPQILSNLHQLLEVSSDNLLLKLLPLEDFLLLALTQALLQQRRQVDYLEQGCRIKSLQEEQYLITNQQQANLASIKIIWSQ
jgi:hypothetical protein